MSHLPFVSSAIRAGKSGELVAGVAAQALLRHGQTSSGFAAGRRFPAQRRLKLIPLRQSPGERVGNRSALVACIHLTRRTVPRQSPSDARAHGGGVALVPFWDSGHWSPRLRASNVLMQAGHWRCLMRPRSDAPGRRTAPRSAGPGGQREPSPSLRACAGRGEPFEVHSPARRAMSACPVRAVPVAAFASRNRINQTFTSAPVRSARAKSVKAFSAANRSPRPDRRFGFAAGAGRAGSSSGRSVASGGRIPPCCSFTSRSVNRRTSAPLRLFCPSWGRASRRRTRPGRTRGRRERLGGRVERGRHVGHGPVTVLLALEQDPAAIVRHEQIRAVAAVFQFGRTPEGRQVQAPVGRSVRALLPATADATSTAAPASQNRRSTAAAVSSCSRLSFEPSPTVKR